MDSPTRKSSIMFGAGVLFVLTISIASIEYLSHVRNQGHYPFLISPPHGLVIGHPYRLLGPITVCPTYLDLLEVDAQMGSRINKGLFTTGDIPRIFGPFAQSMGCRQVATGTFTVKHLHGWSPLTEKTVRWGTGLFLSELPTEDPWWTFIFEDNKWPTDYGD